MFVFVVAEYETPQISLNQVSPVDELIPIPVGITYVYTNINYC